MSEKTKIDIESSLDETERATKAKVESHGVDSLTIDDLTFDDLDSIEWSGGPLHPEWVRKALDRVASGEVDYLAVRAPNGRPIAIGGIDYKVRADTGTMWQLTTVESLRRLGIGTKLIEALEQKILARGFQTATIGVEDTNPKAKALYERLGYQVYGHEKESWEEQNENGEKYMYHADVDLLKKALD